MNINYIDNWGFYIIVYDHYYTLPEIIKFIQSHWPNQFLKGTKIIINDHI